MFEASLMESQGRLPSPTQRWTAVASLALQCSLAAAVIALPLFHPDALPFRLTAPTINLPLKPLPPKVPHVDTANLPHPAPGQSSNPISGHPLPDLEHLHSFTLLPADAAPLSMSSIGSMGDGDTLLTGIANSSAANSTRVGLARQPTATTGPLLISRGVSEGLLLRPIRPVYPHIAITIRTEGTVVIEAVISKTGRIESVHATSGPELLRSAAIDAVRNALYSPYLLNGSPTEVETTITVNFKLAA